MVRPSQPEQEVKRIARKEERPAKCNRTRAERKQIEAVIRQAKDNGKNHAVQDSILFQNMFPEACAGHFLQDHCL